MTRAQFIASICAIPFIGKSLKKKVKAFIEVRTTKDGLKHFKCNDDSFIIDMRSNSTEEFYTKVDKVLDWERRMINKYEVIFEVGYSSPNIQDMEDALRVFQMDARIEKCIKTKTRTAIKGFKPRKYINHYSLNL